MGWFPLADAVGGVVAVSPWVTEFTKLPIHFEPPGKLHLKEINNGLATICSGAVYVFFREATPNYLINIWPWWKLLFLSAVSLFGSAFVFISLWTWWKDDVEQNESKWPIPVQSLCYIILFCSITMGCGLVKLFEDYVHLTGKVIEVQEGFSVKRPLLQLYDTNDGIRWEVRGDHKGNSETFIPKDLFKSIKDWRLEVSAEGYNEERIGIANGNVLVSHWREVLLLKQNRKGKSK